MTPNVVQIVQGALTPEVTAGAADRLGEGPAAVGTALSAVTPGVFTLLNRRAQEEGGPEALLGAIRSGGVAFSLNDPLGRLPAGGAEPSEVLGPEGAALAQRAADYAGVGAASAAALVGMVTPLALGALARTAPPPLNAETLGRTLREQANNIDRAFPPSFTLGGPDPQAPPAASAAPAPRPAPAPTAPDPDRVLAAEAAAASGGGEAVLFPAPGPAPVVQPPATQPAQAAAGGMPKWLLPLLAALVLLVLAFVLLRALGGDDRAPAPAPDGTGQAGAAAPATGAAPGS